MRDSALNPLGTMEYPSSGGLDPLVLDAECRLASPHTRIQLPPLLPSNDSTAAKQPNRRAGAYPRRRAVRACQVCRARRTKCDNKKPSCSFCEKIGAKCVVNDPADLSGYDYPGQDCVLLLFAGLDV